MCHVFKTDRSRTPGTPLQYQYHRYSTADILCKMYSINDVKISITAFSGKAPT